MRFIWPIKAKYVISHVDPKHTETIIARSERDYVWTIARTQTISDARHEGLVAYVMEFGEHVSQLRKLPQESKQRSTALRP